MEKGQYLSLPVRVTVDCHIIQDEGARLSVFGEMAAHHYPQ